MKPSRVRNSKHGLHFCCRRHKDQAQRLNGGITKLHPPHYKDGQYILYRKLAFETYGAICTWCSYSKHERVLEVDHIDGNHHNNDINNLRVLCANCHTERHLVHDSVETAGVEPT